MKAVGTLALGPLGAALSGAAFLVASLAAGAGAAPLPRVASTALCADQYLLLLADRDQIATVSQYAAGPWSWLAERAEGLPSNRGALEELIAARAELLLVSAEVDTQTRRAHDAFGIETVKVEMTNSFEGVEANLRRVSAALGHPERGEAVIADMRARLAAIAPGPDEARPLLVYYRPGGGGAGAGTFVDEVLTAAGYRNLQAELGQTGWAGLPAEALALHRPEGYVISFFDDRRASVSSALRRNPILEAATEDAENAPPILTLPGKLWSCAGPMLVDAAELLAAQRGRFAASAPSAPASAAPASPAPGAEAQDPETPE